MATRQAAPPSSAGRPRTTESRAGVMVPCMSLVCRNLRVTTSELGVEPSAEPVGLIIGVAAPRGGVTLR